MTLEKAAWLCVTVTGVTGQQLSKTETGKRFWIISVFT
jgi:hypothetical protein